MAQANHRVRPHEFDLRECNFAARLDNQAPLVGSGGGEPGKVPALNTAAITFGERFSAVETYRPEPPGPPLARQSPACVTGVGG